MLAFSQATRNSPTHLRFRSVTSSAQQSYLSISGERVPKAASVMCIDADGWIMQQAVLRGLIAGRKENKTVNKARQYRRTKAIIHGDKEVEARYVSGKEVLHNLK